MGHTDFLYKSEGFFDGAAACIDLFGDFQNYNYSKNGSEADVKALYHDMQALRGDAEAALTAIKTQTPGRKRS